MKFPTLQKGAVEVLSVVANLDFKGDCSNAFGIQDMTLFSIFFIVFRTIFQNLKSPFL